MGTELVALPGGLRGRRTTLGAGLPAGLDQLLDGMAHMRTRTIRFLGTRQECMTGGAGEGVHELAPWVTGLYRGMELLLRACLYCGTVEVRDVSLHVAPGLAPGRGGPARRDAVVGWYSGRRPAGRTFM